MSTSSSAPARRRVLMVQRSLEPPGGGNAVAAWMVHALAAQHEVATLTAGDWSIAHTNAFYGTAIPERGVTKHVVPPPWRWMSRLNADRLTRLRMCSVLHYARPLAAHYDLLISADQFAPFPRPGIQYVYYPARLQPEPARLKPVVAVYFRTCDWLLGGRWTDATRNTTLVTSRWTGEGLVRLGELTRPIVLYPPVLDPGEGLPWASRDDVFLCVGRFTAIKRIEVSIAIVERIRATVLPAARMVIVGSPVNDAYSDRVRGLVAERRSWIDVREDLSRAELNALMGRSRFGIQAMIGEHFGMATAEMTRAGCLVFAHDSGGTREVLNGETGLLWSTADEAVSAASGVIANAEAIRSRLMHHARLFSAERFVAQFRTIVETFR